MPALIMLDCTMYTPAPFAEDRPEIIRALIAAHPFATLVTTGDSGLMATHLPLLFEPRDGEEGQLVGHVARPNPQWRELDPDTEALAIFQGPHGYITPSWYPTKQATGKVVPTWNYAAVHVYGRLRVIRERDWLLDHVRRLTQRMEARHAEPWALDDAPPEFVEAMLRGIVGIEVAITRIEGKWKMSQNRPPADRDGVVAGLTASGDGADQELAEAMLRP
jgi:transcriptional regulator